MNGYILIMAVTGVVIPIVWMVACIYAFTSKKLELWALLIVVALSLATTLFAVSYIFGIAERLAGL